MRFTAALVTPGVLASARCTVAWHAAQVIPSTGRVILAVPKVPKVPKVPEVPGTLCLSGYLEAGAIDGFPDDLRGHAFVEAQMRLANLDLDQLDAGQGREHARQAVDAAAARHALDGEGL